MIAIIPARGGSKGLPGKNIRILNGIPLIAYSIRAALKSKRVSRIIVSTDDQDIAAIGKEYGAEIPFMRPEYLATDTARAIDVYNYTIDRLEKEDGVKINDFLILQPTSPLRNEAHIDEAVELFYRKDADSVLSYCKEFHPINWHRYIKEDFKIEPGLENSLKNRQVDRATYFPNGAIYIFKREILSKGKYVTDNSYAYIMEKNESVDVDYLEDFEYAEYLMKKK